MVRSVTGVVLAVALAVTVGGGAPLHLVQAHADVSPAGHDCAICKSLSHDPGHLATQPPAAPADAGCARVVAADPQGAIDDPPAVGAPRGPPYLLA